MLGVYTWVYTPKIVYITFFQLYDYNFINIFSYGTTKMFLNTVSKVMYMDIVQSSVN